MEHCTNSPFPQRVRASTSTFIMTTQQRKSVLFSTKKAWLKTNASTKVQHAKVASVNHSDFSTTNASKTSQTALLTNLLPSHAKPAAKLQSSLMACAYKKQTAEACARLCQYETDKSAYLFNKQLIFFYVYFLQIYLFPDSFILVFPINFYGQPKIYRLNENYPLPETSIKK